MAQTVCIVEIPGGSKLADVMCLEKVEQCLVQTQKEYTQG